MNYNNNPDSKFTKLARVRKTQYDWLVTNKDKHGAKTIAGFLDQIINNFKRYGHKAPKNP
jgi:hypothetical protein